MYTMKFRLKDDNNIRVLVDTDLEVLFNQYNIFVMDKEVKSAKIYNEETGQLIRAFSKGH